MFRTRCDDMLGMGVPANLSPIKREKSSTELRGR
jgi:hypothetical protein